MNLATQSFLSFGAQSLAVGGTFPTSRFHLAVVLAGHSLAVLIICSLMFFSFSTTGRSSFSFIRAWYRHHVYRLMQPVSWFCWHLLVFVVKICSFGAANLSKAKIDGSAIGHIWRLLWPYLVSTREWRINLPRSVRIPALTCAGWQTREARIWLWTPTVIIAIGFVLQVCSPSALMAVLHWLGPRNSSFELWPYFISGRFVTIVVGYTALFISLKILSGWLFPKGVRFKIWKYQPLPIVLPDLISLPWFNFANWRWQQKDVRLAGRQLFSLPLLCQAWLFFGLIGLGCWAVNQVGVLANTLNGTLITSATNRDAPVFMHVLAQFGGIMAFMTVLLPVYAWVKELVILSWTKFCTALLLDEYTDEVVQGYYAISLRQEPDNPNERIQQDLAALCRQVMIFLFALLEAVITVWLFSQVILEIEDGLKFEVPFFKHTMVVGHLMFTCLIIYAILGTNGAVHVGKRLIGLNAEQKKLSAHFRVLMVLFEKYAEPIAAYRGEKHEYKQLWRRFAAALANNYVIVRWSMLLSVFTGGYGRVAQFLPLLTLAPFYFARKIEFGIISQSAGACAEILGAFSLIVQRFDSISEMLALGNRVGELRTALARIKADREAVRPRIEREEEVEGVLIDVQGMDLYLPGGTKLIVKGLNLRVEPGEHVLFRGPSGSGKTSVLRAIQGFPLWDYGMGKVRIAPHRQRIMLSQLAYLLKEGSLREQLLYPAAANVSNRELMAVLKEVNLTDLIQRLVEVVKTTHANWDCLTEVEQQCLILDVATNWDSISGGERQRLVVARALVNKVRLVLADECTSGLDTKNEDILYRDMQNAGITIVSVGHRPTLLKYHQHVVELLNDGEGGWRQMEASQCQWEDPGTQAESD